MASSILDSMPTSGELEVAIATLTWALESLNIKYGIIGGGAVSILAHQYGLSTHQTEDIDVIIQPTQVISAETISDRLCIDSACPQLFTYKTIYGVKCPQVIVMRGQRQIYVGIECFDHSVWPQRRDVYDLDLPSNSTVEMQVGGRPAHLLNPQWLLRQKIESYNGRGSGTKRQNDLEDIHTLCNILIGSNEKLDIVGSYGVDNLKAVLNDPQAEKGLIQQAINCTDVFPTA